MSKRTERTLEIIAILGGAAALVFGGLWYPLVASILFVVANRYFTISEPRER